MFNRILHAPAKGKVALFSYSPMLFLHSRPCIHAFAIECTNRDFQVAHFAALDVPLTTACPHYRCQCAGIMRCTYVPTRRQPRPSSDRLASTAECPMQFLGSSAPTAALRGMFATAVRGFGDRRCAARARRNMARATESLFVFVFVAV
jgi:hypothetical protein